MKTVEIQRAKLKNKLMYRVKSMKNDLKFAILEAKKLYDLYQPGDEGKFHSHIVLTNLQQALTYLSDTIEKDES